MIGKEFIIRCDTLLRERHEKRESLSKATGVPLQTFSNWLIRDNAPPVDKVILIARYFNKSIDYMATGEDYNSKLSKEDVELITKIHTLKGSNREFALRAIDDSYK